MRDEYNIRELNPSKNPYTSKVKVTIDVEGSTLDYFKSMAAVDGRWNPVSDPYQSLFEGLCGQSQKNSNVLAVMKKRKNAVFFRFLYCYTSINVVNYKYSYLQKYKTIKVGA